VHNQGTAPATGIIVRYYAGNPSQGGTALFDEPVPGTLAAGDQVSFDVTIPGFPSGLEVEIWAVVDPDDAIAECNDGNNGDAAGTKILCSDIN
jgi:subtilase family serine protease